MAVPTKSIGQQLKKNDITILLKLLSNSSDKWNNIGIELGFLISELRQIRLSQSLLTGAPQSYLKELLQQWLEWPTDIHPDPPTLKALCSALRSSLVGQGCLADELEGKMKQYLELQEPIAQSNASIMIELFHSIKRGNIGHITFMLSEKDVDINCAVNTHKKIETALIVACRVGNPATIKELLVHKAEVNLQTSTGKCALMEACRYGKTDAVILLLKNGAQVDLQAEDGTSSLMIASLEGHIDIIKLLLNHGAKVDLRASGNKSAFVLASQNGQIEVIKFFLKHDQINVEEKDIYAAMLFASQSGHIEILKFLLKLTSKGTDSAGSALVLASQYGHVEIVEMLLSFGVKVDFQENDTQSALMAASQNGHTKVVQLLLEYNAMIDLQQSNGYTALMLAIQHGYTETAQILLEYGAATNLRDNNGVTALMLACQNGHIEIVKMICHQNAEIEIKDNSGFSAMMYACKNGHTDIVELLFDCGAQLDTYTNSGLTSLMLACFSGHFEVAKLLVEQGANINLQAMDGSFRYAHTFAKEQGHVRIVNFLKNQADFKDMFKILIPIATKWKTLGTLLDVDDTKLDTIDAESKDDEDGLKHVLKEWLKFTNPPPTVKLLAEAVSILNEEIAKTLLEL